MTLLTEWSMEKNNSRNILWYFFRSKLWAAYASSFTYNIAYQSTKDPERARRMHAINNNEVAKKSGKVGISIDDYIWDAISCVYEAESTDKISQATSNRLLSELYTLETYHKEMGTWTSQI
jgi:hypothetical protein